jgi:histidyl-tRNA synthetase
MRTPERELNRESISAVIASIARTYGFSNPPVALTKKSVTQVVGAANPSIAATAALADSVAPDTVPQTEEDTEKTIQAWGIAREGHGSVVVFVIANPKHAISQAFVVKAALAATESAGYENCIVKISSVGDEESRRRYLRELGNFFKKQAKYLPEELIEDALKDPERAARTLIESEHPLAEGLPRTIDFLSESSRKIMLETISLFESLHISYELAPHLPYTKEVNAELVFVIEGERKGERVEVAHGGKFDGYLKEKEAPCGAVGMGIFLPNKIEMRPTLAVRPACFVMHIGEAAKIRAFCLLDALWQSKVALDQALLLSTMQDQMELAKKSGAKYLAIIGQSEALEGTVIVRNTATHIQEILPVNQAVSRLGRVRV